ncbi:hypothetical protein EMIHUDRAFT_123646, partial [Emiliania huxleyi CCMP1516]|uniref:Uncharacterized protein n=2 Tax=Emiliania huxleyi TaxID=2903 RepID=A0A0D3JKW4_EMIH1
MPDTCFALGAIFKAAAAAAGSGFGAEGSNLKSAQKRLGASLTSGSFSIGASTRAVGLHIEKLRDTRAPRPPLATGLAEALMNVRREGGTSLSRCVLVVLWPPVKMSIAGSAASFTVKIMNAGTGRDLAEQLAPPLIKGLLGLTASAAELAAATQAEQSVHATKTYTARQTARFYPGWRDWKTAFEQAAAAPRPRTDPPNTGGAGPAAPRPVSILGAPFALEMFRKLPASGSVAAGTVEAAEVLGLCDKMPALGASMLPEAVRIQSFAVALEAAAGEAAHTSLRGEISAKGQLTLAEATAFLGRFGQAFKASAPSPAAPTTPYEALVRRVDAGGQFDEFMEKTIPFICTDAAHQRVAEGDQA